MPFLDRRAATAGLVAGAGLGFIGCSAANERVLRSADAHPADYPTVLAVDEMGRLLEERSEGRLSIKTYAGGQLGAEKDALEITIFGGLDLTRVSIAPLSAIAAEAVVPALPFLFRNTAHMRAALDGAPGETILAALEPHGLIGLCFYDAGARSFYTRDRAIMAPEDLKGLKIRVMNSDMFVSMVETLGGDAAPMPYGEVYQGLMQGVVDGAENNWPSYESSRHFEAAPVYSLTRHVMAPEVLVMSAKRWRRLSEEDRALIRQCAKDSVPFMRAVWDERSRKAEEHLRAANVEIVTPDTQAFVEKVKPVWDRYLTTPALHRLADDIRTLGQTKEAGDV
ncbi:TRAP transporter substrate-binding protein [Hyphococcus luteus]|uniref:C4-dicarboxylate ABC transporter n=1 Tax=Hyphococcus luteus TaxID=2058213 RepID=A0A2S7KB77_9PROT|nr:TRAP transporter substrate-binding protein [Marinicaulis flavus]PQA89770.1 C4-dicarboxylate ABC transporter [Marinicaulis flavus]